MITSEPSLSNPWPAFIAIAHRGAPTLAPPNSLASFVAAVAAGAAMIETDIRLTRDRVLVLSHDDTVRPAHGRPLSIAASTWATLRDTPHLATLDDLLTSLSGRCLFNLDLKTDDAAPELIATLRRFATHQSTLVSGAARQSFAALRTAWPTLPIALSCAARPGDGARAWVDRCAAQYALNRASALAQQAHAMHANALALDHHMVSKALISALALHRLPVYVWTVDAPCRISQLHQWGASGVATNRIDRHARLTSPHL